MKTELIKKEDGSWEIKLPESEDTANLEAKAGILSSITGIKAFGIPVGEAAGGLLAVSVWDALRGLVGGVLPSQIPAWAIPAIGAWLMSTKQLQGMLGSTAANTAGIILTADTVQALFNVRGLISGLFNRSGKTVPAGITSNNSGIDAELASMGLS
uniref:Uncharacterized protein n=1 Tax=viral metagenome TaxID=1070528 RepID=A0A6M3KGG4_9ZZZZ